MSEPIDEKPGADGLDSTDNAEHGRIVELCSAANVVEAYVLRNYLDTEGICCRVVGDMLGGALGELPFGTVTSPRLWVREEDVERARAIIDQRRL